MATPDTAHSVVIVKSFSWKGTTQRWSNRYHFTGSTLPSSGQWDTLMDAIVTAEKAVLPSFVTIVEGIGYDASTATSTNPHGLAVHSKTYTTAGTAVSTGGAFTPGEAAAFIRYTTTQRTTKNHPIYLFNYYHGVIADAAVSADNVLPSQLSAYNVYGAAWVSGFSDGTLTRIRCGPRGAVAQSRAAHDRITHRDFPR
jgi:hypothetical protein